MENHPQFQAVLDTLSSLKCKLHINGNKQERNRISNHFSQFDFKTHMQPDHIHEALEVCPDSPLEAAQHALALCYQDAMPDNSRVSGIEIRTNTKLSFN